MSNELKKMCGTCPHRHIANTDKCQSVEIAIPPGKWVAKETPNPCHEDTRRVCRGSVINIRHREEGGSNNGNTVHLRGKPLRRELPIKEIEKEFSE